MEKFTTLLAVACPLGVANVDTDQLIPARFMKRSRDAGYGRYLLHDLRFEADGTPRVGSIIDAPVYAGAKVLIAGRNFGIGSSREAAVYALHDFGFRCVIAPSFGDIFASNATKNGLLTATVAEHEVEMLVAQLATTAHPVLSIDLENKMITIGSVEICFTVDPVHRLQLLNGWDDIDLTCRFSAEIGVFKAAATATHPWAMLPEQARLKIG